MQVNEDDDEPIREEISRLPMTQAELNQFAADLGIPEEQTKEEFLAGADDAFAKDLIKFSEKGIYKPGSRKEFSQLIVEHMLFRNIPMIIEKMIEIGMGVWYEKTYVTSKGKEVRKIYKESPNAQALKYLADRHLGMTPYAKEDANDKTGPVAITEMEITVPKREAAASGGSKSGPKRKR